MPTGTQAKSKAHPHDVDDGPYYCVDLDEPGGPGSWGCRAHSVAEAMAKAERAHRGMNCRVVGAAFDKLHLQNRVPESETKIYRGIPLVAGETYVTVRLSSGIICHELKPRLDLANHSPTGLSWGYEGSGCAQLSLALLADALEDDERALRIYQPFKKAYIANIPIKKKWWLTPGFIQMLACFTERQMAVGLAA